MVSFRTGKRAFRKVVKEELPSVGAASALLFGGGLGIQQYLSHTGRWNLDHIVGLYKDALVLNGANAVLAGGVVIGGYIAAKLWNLYSIKHRRLRSILIIYSCPGQSS